MPPVSPAGGVRGACHGLAMAVLLCVSPAWACVHQEPAGYRQADYRAPVPCTIRGAHVLSTRALQELIRSRAPVLVDVLPAPRRPAGLSDDSLWLPPERRDIPGSVWLPNTGFGLLPVQEERYLRENLARLTGGDLRRPLVFYCLANCWMSWNAAKRAVEWGYRDVHWYPDGSDGWADAGLPLAPAVPVARGPGQ
jgi:PQQ-dependent catabolism-associated CXXCW motif protein